MRVTITNDRVEIETDNTDVGYVVDKAQKLYEETRSPDRPPGSGIGFTQQIEARPRWDSKRFGAGESLQPRAEESNGG